jgi:hypothetical protein
MEIFQNLGTEIETQWREQNYDEAVFADIATAALSGADLLNKVSVWEIAAWTLNQTRLPEQRDLSAKFGDPPITLFNAPRFHIDIYFWLEGTTAIHQHGFCGAFQVFLGSSLHSTFEFETRERVNFHTAVGETKLESCELLKLGDVRPIRGGKVYIHSLFHLDYPSATIVVRTYRSPIELPQFDYRKPSLAIDPFFEEPTTVKKQQTISMLLRVNAPETDEMIDNLLAESDFQTSFHLLSAIKANLGGRMDDFFQLDAGKNRFNRFLETVGRKHPNQADVFPRVFAEAERQQEIVNRRTFVTDPDLRYFLALLLNVEGRERILALVEERAPAQNPLDTILDWTLALSETKVLGSKLPNALGIADFNDDYLFVLEGLLKNESIETMQAKVNADYPAHYAIEFVPKIPQYAAALQSSPLFHALFAA